MKISNITATDVAAFLRLDDATDPLLTPMMDAAKQYIIDYTGLTATQLDDHEDFYIAYMVLVQDMYDNRAMYVDKNNVNGVVESVLFRHRVNFLPTTGFTEDDPEEPAEETPTDPPEPSGEPAGENADEPVEGVG